MIDSKLPTNGQTHFHFNPLLFQKNAIVTPILWTTFFDLIVDQVRSSNIDINVLFLQHSFSSLETLNG